MPKRCALGCPFISGKTYHQFPHPVRNPDRFKAWVGIAGGKLDSQDEILLYSKKVLCDIHFMDKDRNRNNRLNCLAVPSLHLDGKSDKVDSSDKEVLPFKPVHEEGSCSMLSPTVTVVVDPKTSTQVPGSELTLDLPSTSYEMLISLSDYKAQNKISTHVSPMSETILDFPSPISKETFTFSGALDITSAKASPILKSKNNHLKEHSYSAQDKTDITNAGESKYHQPPPPFVNQLQTARKRVKQLQSEVIRLRKRKNIVKTRLINAKKNSKHNCLQKITQNMTAAAKTFTHMQFTQTQKRNKGRRFTLEGQQLCLSIYKSSPQCYDLLSKLFTLPSAKTLKRLIRKQFDIQPGFNNGEDEGPILPATFGDEPYIMHCGDIV